LDHIADFLHFPLQGPILLVFAQYELRPWPPPCQLIPFGPGRLRGCVASSRAALSSPRHASWLSHLASSRPLIVPPSRQLVTPACCCIASPYPLIALPSHRLVPPAGCRIASRHPLVAPHSCQLVAPACCRIASPHPLVAIWLLRRLSMRRPLVLSLSRRFASRCLVVPAGCCAIISCCPLVAPPSRPLIMLAGCCVACPCTAFSSSCRSPSPTPSNTIERCCRH